MTFVFQEYISFLNEFRVKLRSSQLKQSESKVSAEVTHASQAYHDLLDRVSKLSDRFGRVGNKVKDYNVFRSRSLFLKFLSNKKI